MNDSQRLLVNGCAIGTAILGFVAGNSYLEKEGIMAAIRTCGQQSDFRACMHRAFPLEVPVDLSSLTAFTPATAQK